MHVMLSQPQFSPSEGTFATKRSGFSLIELLVVIAIIGILAAVGVTSYQAYISATRDGVVKADTENLSRILETDHVALTSDISARSKFSETMTETSLCRDQADKMVHEINTIQNKKNPHNKSCPFAFNGNRAWSSSSYLDSANVVNYLPRRKVSCDRLRQCCNRTAGPNDGGL